MNVQLFHIFPLGLLEPMPVMTDTIFRKHHLDQWLWPHCHIAPTPTQLHRFMFHGLKKASTSLYKLRNATSNTSTKVGCH